MTSSESYEPLTATSMSWATYFGANGIEFFQSVVEHDDGSVGAAGWTLSNMLPVSPGAFQPTQSSDGGETGFATRFSADGGGLLYATFLGGSTKDEIGAALAGDDGELIVAGYTVSEDFPTTPGAFDEERDPFSSDAFVAKLTADGSDLVFSTYFGGQVPDSLPPGTSGSEVITSIALDSHGDILVAGTARDDFLPATEGAYQVALAKASNPQDGFIARLSHDASSVIRTTYLGGGGIPGQGSGVEWLHGLTVLPDDSIVVVGHTSSKLFPTTPGAFQPDPPDGFNGFVARLSPDLSSLVFGSYLGGDGWDEARAVGSLPDGGIVVAGKVESMFQFGTEYDFPITPDAFDPVPGGPSEGFLVHIAPDGSRLRYGTYFGGSGRDDWPMSMVVDRAGGVTVACQTSSFDAAVTPGALQPENHTSSNDATAYIARFHPDLSLLYGTYLGGTTWDVGKGADRLGLAVGDLGDLLIAQGTFSDEFPLTAGSPFPEKQLKVDGFLASLTMLPTGVTRYGTSTPGATGRLALGALAMPRVGADGFGFSCTGAPANAPGFLVLSMDALDSPASVGGAALWVDPARLLGVLPVVANAHGYAQRRVAIPSDPAIAGFTAHAQFLWPGAGVATHASATAAVRVVVQR